MLSKCKHYLINSNAPFKGSWQLTEQDGTFYVVSDTEVLASEDGGETWNSLGTRPEGQLIDIVITDETFYLGLVDGVFRSVDGGEFWTSLDDGHLKDRKIRTLTAIENTLFVGTDSGLYRSSSGGWDLLRVDGEVENIRALTSSEHRLYVIVGEEAKNNLTSQFMSTMTTRRASLSLYLSEDLGASWQAIDPKKDLPVQTSGFTFGTPVDSKTEPTSSIKLVALKESLLVLDSGRSYYSSDAGKTWVVLHSSFSDMDTPPVVVMIDENTFYRSGRDGVHRSTDTGKTWQQFNTGLVNTSIGHLVAVRDILYADIGGALFSSSNGGEAWLPVPGARGNIWNLHENDGALYARGAEGMIPRLFRLSVEDNRLIPIPGMPGLAGNGFDERLTEEINLALIGTLQDEGKKSIEAGEKLNPVHFDADKFNEAYSKIMEKTMADSLQILIGSFAVSDETYYIEARQRLLRWKPGATEWYDTGLVDESGPYPLSDLNILSNIASVGFKVAASGDTVYVGKRDGHLFQSYDEGNTWNDVTADLPFAISDFNVIVFAGSTVYIATDQGVAYSSDGKQWQTATDVEGTPVVVERLAVDGTTLCGATAQRVYQLKENSNTWKQIGPDVSRSVTSLTIDGDTLYVGTLGRGVLRFILDEI
ncbi:MAG: hypothetical protein OXU36_18605 [Candidatus Poribacteria bacterium]|nr:hypothetical protein [Candidatus Poribacteria bacterium]